jgi:hypothetical protein
MTRPTIQRRLQEQQTQRRQEEEAVRTFSTIAAVIYTTEAFENSLHHRRRHQNQGKVLVQHWGSRSLLLVFGILWIAQQPLRGVAAFTIGECSLHHGHQLFHSNHHRRYASENILEMRSSKATQGVQRRINQQLKYCSLQQGIVAVPVSLSHHRGSPSVSASYGQAQPKRNQDVVVCHGKKWTVPTPFTCSRGSLSKHLPQPSRSSYSSTRLFASMAPSSSSSSPLEPTGSGSGSDDNYSPYDQWVRRLYMTNLFHPVKMGLKNMQQLHELLGYPMDNVRSILGLGLI